MGTINPDATRDPSPGAALIEVHVSDLKQLFDSLDPTPFHQRDLDPKAEEFIVGWAREHRGDRSLALLVHADQAGASPDATAIVDSAVRDHFRRRADSTRLKLRQLLRLGRLSLVIGLAFLAACVAAGDVIEALLPETRFAIIFRESLIIGGWVAMWRPIQIFLYDWWPIRADARLFDRLSTMTVRVTPPRAP